MQNSGVLGGFYVLADWIYRFCIGNLIWLVFNIPIVFLLLNLLLAETMGVIFVLTGMILLLSPFIFYPATVALFSIVDKFIKKEDVRVIHDFCISYKKNYRRSMKIGAVFAAFWAVLLIDFFYLVQVGNTAFVYFFIVIGFFAFIYNLLVCSSVNYFDLPIKKLFRNVAILMFGHPILSMSLGLISVVFLYGLTQWATILLPFLTGSVIAFLSLLVFIKIYLVEKQKH
ncbi:DUF624 domain-containing protein [Gracilibacillus oryzae]|uniref:DUF624 domain-containing protein n=1 Tax=Gracilibacillus oryzae TaxID=1672701 RepID=A0A7C8KUZ8_9BACI|nr:DUF624 domain-containing protein [Gracilibacillus oryzae]KAB8137856.1 DUF624 domain-containing protein [Gracilibacillus oryzae]